MLAASSADAAAAVAWIWLPEQQGDNVLRQGLCHAGVLKPLHLTSCKHNQINKQDFTHQLYFHALEQHPATPHLVEGVCHSTTLNLSAHSVAAYERLEV